MKKIAISIRNRVFSESIYLMLKQTGDFHPVRLPSAPPEILLVECRTEKPDVLLMDVTPSPPEATLESRLLLAEYLAEEQPGCKTVLFCDETAYPRLAREVMRAKQAGKVDQFLYGSVTLEYLAATLEAL